jgi:PilZ domain
MRAPRFPLKLDVVYRAPGQLEWQQAQTANVSSSGVLVQAQYAPQVNTPLEFRLALAPRQGSGTRSHVSGRGHVVRQVLSPDRASLGFALAIDEYDFTPVSQLQTA